MVALKSLAAASLAVFPAVSLAEQIFYNNGTLDGWDNIGEEHDGTVEEVTDNVFAGESALKMSQTYDEDYDGRYHSEAGYKDGYTRGDERFYGFAFRLADDWEFGDQGYNLAQFIAQRDGAPCDDEWMPSTMISLKGDKLEARIVYGNYREPDCTRDMSKFKQLVSVTPGDWHTVVLQANWESDESGVFKMWFNGDVIVDKSGVATTLNDDENFQFRVGLYANGWHDDGEMEGDQPTREVWYDEVAIGSSYEEVEPKKD